jgi:DDE superfamily endonuclease
VTGGTTHGWFAVHRPTVPSDGVPGFHQPDARRVSAAGPALRDRVPRPDGGLADGWETADRAPVYRLQKLPPPDTGRPALVHLGLPQNLCPPGGARALIRHGPGQSESVDPRPVADVARGAARPRRCPHPLPDRPRPAARRLGGRRGDRGRPSGGGARPCGAHPSRRAGLPPFAHDGTERRIVHPQDPAEQKESYSGKKKDHTVKNVLLVNALLIILFLSDTYGGRTHDKPIADATPYPLPAGSRLLQDLGFLAFTLPQVAILMPTKKPRGQELPLEEQLANQALHQRRLRIEHVNSSVKRCRIVKDRIRLWKQGVRDLVMELCCALHNFRVRLTPWQPMV